MPAEFTPELDVAAEIEAFGHYLNAPRGHLDDDEQALFDQDLAKAKAQMERAWLENKPTHEGDHPR